MTETVLQSIDYRGYRLTEIRRVIVANPDNAVQLRWRITLLDGGVENIVREVMSLDAAKKKVDQELKNRGEESGDTIEESGESGDI